MTALKIWFSSNNVQLNTIDSIHDDLRALKLDDTITAHEHTNKFMNLIEPLSTLGKEIPPQTARNLYDH